MIDIVFCKWDFSSGRFSNQNHLIYIDDSTYRIWFVKNYIWSWLEKNTKSEYSIYYSAELRGELKDSVWVFMNIVVRFGSNSEAMLFKLTWM